MKQVTKAVEIINQEIKDGIIRNVDQSSTNMSGIDTSLHIKVDPSDGQNILLINKGLVTNKDTSQQAISDIEGSNSDVEQEKEHFETSEA